MTKNGVRRVVLEIPSDMAFLKMAQDFSDRAFTTLRLEEREKMAFSLVVSELATNAICHGNGGDADKKIKLIFELHDNRLILRVQDEGAGFDLEAVKLREQTPNLSENHGRGIFLVDSYMDSIASSRAPGCFEVIVSKARQLEKQGAHSMNIEARKLDNATIVDAEGKLDATSTPAIKECIKSLMEEGRTQILLNLEKVPFVNSTGLGALVGILKDLRGHKGILKLLNLQPYVQELFEVTQLVKVFEIFTDEDTAVKSFEN